MSEIKSQNKPKHFLRETAFYQMIMPSESGRGGQIRAPPDVQTAFKQENRRC
ncbi:hypothetical protein O8D90_000675 [Neisseria gonorrhoeae]